MLSFPFAPDNILFDDFWRPSWSSENIHVDPENPGELLDAVTENNTKLSEAERTEIEARLRNLSEIEKQKVKTRAVTELQLLKLKSTMDDNDVVGTDVDNFMSEIKNPTAETASASPTTNQDILKNFNESNELLDLPSIQAQTAPLKMAELAPLSKEYISKSSTSGLLDFVHSFAPKFAVILSKLLKFGDYETHLRNKSIKKHLRETTRKYTKTLNKIVRFDQLNNEQFDKVIAIAKKNGIDLGNQQHLDAAFLWKYRWALNGELDHCHCVYYGLNQIRTNTSDPVERFQLIFDNAVDEDETLIHQVYAKKAPPTPPPAPDQDETPEEKTPELTLSSELSTLVDNMRTVLDDEENGALRKHLVTNEKVTAEDRAKLGNKNSALNSFHAKKSELIRLIEETPEILEKVGYDVEKDGAITEDTADLTIALLITEMSKKSGQTERWAYEFRQGLITSYANSRWTLLEEFGITEVLSDQSIVKDENNLYRPIDEQHINNIDVETLTLLKEGAQKYLKNEVQKEWNHLISYLDNLKSKEGTSAFHSEVDKTELLKVLEQGFKTTASNAPDFPDIQDPKMLSLGIQKYKEEIGGLRHFSQTLKNRATVFSGTNSKWTNWKGEDDIKISTYEAKNLINLAKMEGSNYFDVSDSLMSYLDTEELSDDKSIKNSSETLDSEETIEKVIRQVIEKLDDDKRLADLLVSRLMPNLKKSRENKWYVYYLIWELQAKITQLHNESGNDLAKNMDRLSKQNFTTLEQWKHGEFEEFVKPDAPERPESDPEADSPETPENPSSPSALT